LHAGTVIIKNQLTTNYRIFHEASILLCCCLLLSCAPSRFVKPLDKGQQAVNLSLGVPLIEFSGLAISTPLITATYGKGFDLALKPI
jgi:hypothetical protein